MKPRVMPSRPVHAAQSPGVSAKRLRPRRYLEPRHELGGPHRGREDRGAALGSADQGQVVAVGNGKIQEDGKVRPMSLKVGERVLFGKYSGQAVKVDGEELLVMREEDIMGVVEA